MICFHEGAIAFGYQPALVVVNLGFGDEEMIEAATEQMHALPYYHLFGAKGMEPAIELAEALKEIAPMPMSDCCSSVRAWASRRPM